MNKARMPTLPISIQHRIISLRQRNQTSERYKKEEKTKTKQKNNPSRLERKKQTYLYCYWQDLHVESLKLTTKNMLITEFSRVAGFKMNKQKFHLFLYTNNKQSKKNVKKTDL